MLTISRPRVWMAERRSGAMWTHCLRARVAEMLGPPETIMIDSGATKLLKLNQHKLSAIYKRVLYHNHLFAVQNAGHQHELRRII